MRQIISCAEARAAGLRFYFTGKPCGNGHICDRYVPNSRCVECRKESSSARHARYREQRNAYAKRYYQANKDYFAEHNRTYRSENLSERRAYCSAWKKANPEKNAAATRNRHALKRASGSHTADDILKIGGCQKWRCASCRRNIRDDYHVDHVEPLALGGSNDQSNLQLLCPPCNQSKHAKDPFRWAHENGRLL